MSGSEHRYRDPDGCEVLIRPSADHENAAYFATSGDDFAVPNYRLAEVTRAMWAAAGEVAPDLPVIYDPALVEELARDLSRFSDGTKPYGTYAQKLLDAGWRKP